MGYVRQILTDNHPTLRKVAKKVNPVEIREPLFQQLLEDMFATMYAAPGIGLAAPQINISKRIFVYDIEDEGERYGPGVVINPKFTLMEEEIEATEGCLSVPGYVGETLRFDRVVCVGLDRYGKRVVVEGQALFARCLQHEVDHLNGVLYIDTAKNIRPAVTEEERKIAEAAVAEGAPAEA